MQKPFLFFFSPQSNSSSRWASTFLTPSPHNLLASLYSSQGTYPYFHENACAFSSHSPVRPEAPVLLPSFPDFVQLGTKSSCSLRKASLEICQFCTSAFPLRTDFQGVLLANSLESWKLTFVKHRVLILLFVCLTSIRSVNYTIASQLYHYIPGNLQSLHRHW